MLKRDLSPKIGMKGKKNDVFWFVLGFGEPGGAPLCKNPMNTSRRL